MLLEIITLVLHYYYYCIMHNVEYPTDLTFPRTFKAVLGNSEFLICSITLKIDTELR